MIYTESTHAAEFLVSEANGDRSRDQATIAYSSDLAPGTVLGQVTSSGKYKQHDPSASDGSQTATAVLYAEAAASTGDVQAVVIARSAEVVERALVFADNISQSNRTAAIDALNAKGIVAR